jgi:hypothetical protein
VRKRGATLAGVVHVVDDVLEALTLGRLTTAESLRIQKHIFGCPACLKRLIAVEVELSIGDAHNPPRSLRADMTKPLFMRHDTADGFIYSRIEKHGDKWLERHWGEQLQGQHSCQTLKEANEHAMAAFEQMFPEHRCTERCCLDPVTKP